MRARTAQDQDEPVRSREARLDLRRPAARDLQVHLRRQAGDDARHEWASAGATAAGCSIGRPTSTWLPDGTFFISDGYGGTRVAKFDKDGKFLKDWGSAPKDPKNPGPNEFNTVHSIPISKDRRLFVVDRGPPAHSGLRREGKFLDMWTTGVRSQPYAHIITTDQSIWVADGGTNRIVKYDLNGKYLYGWGGPGGLPGQLNGPHSITVDQDGNLYLAEVFNGRVAEVPAESGRRSGEGRRPGAALSGDRQQKLATSPWVSR